MFYFQAKNKTQKKKIKLKSEEKKKKVTKQAHCPNLTHGWQQKLKSETEKQSSSPPPPPQTRATSIIASQIGDRSSPLPHQSDQRSE